MTKTAEDIITLLEQKVHSNPSAPAVVSASFQISYEQLFQQSTSIAHVIADTAEHARVLISCMTPSNVYASMIGTLMAGGTFCPMPVDCPRARRRLILDSFSPHLFLADAAIFSEWSFPGIPSCNVDAVSPVLRPLRLPASPVAYVIFTSGSTGTPKGVAMSRSGFSYFLVASRPHFNATDKDRWAQFSNIGYDLAIMDIFMALSAGATLIPVTSPAQALRPASLIAHQGVTILQTVPRTADFLIAEGASLRDQLKDLRLMSFCGAPLQPHHLKCLFQAAPHLVVQNTYGATETTGYNTRQLLTASDYGKYCNGTVALGSSVPGWDITFVNSETDHCGEIAVTSSHLAVGYWNDRLATQRVFRERSEEVGSHLKTYTTGDWGEICDGLFFFRGRIDRQVKIGGIRLELDEIDHHIVGFGASESATVCTDDQKLVSFIAGVTVEAEANMRNYLSQHLPKLVLPSKIIILDALPRNANGKVDFPTLRKECPV